MASDEANTEVHAANDEPQANSESSNDNDTSSSKILNELVYSSASFYAIFAPVSITMILSALAVVYINTDESRAAGQAAYSSTYEVFDLEPGDNSQNLAASVANTLIIVSVICVMTFVVVLLYKYRCMKVFFGYMVLVTALLLGYFTSNMWIVAIDKYGWKIDKLSFAYVIWNYAVVGVAAIFKPIGIPKFVSQGYLVTCSVVLAWQLSYFNEWTAWTLLVVLALYDLFAVLTPCGPLKALAGLMSRPGAPQLPGLLYEASLPSHVQRPNRPRPVPESGGNREQRAAGSPTEASSQQTEQTDGETPSVTSIQAGSEPQVSIHVEGTETRSPVPVVEGGRGEETTHGVKVSMPAQLDSMERTSSHDSAQMTRSTPSQNHTTHQATSQRQVDRPSADNLEDSPKGMLPLAIAKMYKLPVIDVNRKLRRRGEPRNRVDPRFYTPEEIRESEWTAKQLRSQVMAVFPQRGGRIESETDSSSDRGPRYIVYNRTGEVLRTFVVDRNGKVLQVVRRDTSEDEPQDNSIKLGLGDFIFYSVLVSKAALYSFASFASCMLVILTGLGGTLILLAVYGKALPALPISIFMGVSVFFMSRYLLEPWLEVTWRGPLYV